MTSILLTACAGFGGDEKFAAAPPPPEESKTLPPVPPDIVACLQSRGVPPPPAGKRLGTKAAANLIAALKIQGDAWQACGLQLIEYWRSFEQPAQGPLVIRGTLQ